MTWCIMDTDYGKSALKDFDLYKSIVKHRARFYHLNDVDYSTDLPDRIQIVPKGDLLDKFQADYIQMKESMIYGDKFEFEYIIARLEELQSKIRSINESGKSS